MDDSFVPLTSFQRPRPTLVRVVVGLLQAVPTIIVLGLLVTIGWYGHQFGWTLPKFSSLHDHGTEKDDWCNEHAVPESICAECNDTLSPKATAKGWCKLHGIPECTLCHPELAQLLKIPSVTSARLNQAKLALAFSERTSNNPICKTHLRRIQFIDALAVEKAGIAVEPVWTAPAIEFVSAPGEIGFDQTRVAHLSSRATGSVFRVFKRVGDGVRRGDVLALIEAADVGKAKAELQQEMATLRLRRDQLTGKQAGAGAISESQIRISEAAVRDSEIRSEAARQSLVNLGLPLASAELTGLSTDQLKAKLHFLGVPDSVRQTLDQETTTSNLLPVLAPIDGVIVSQNIVAGEVVDSTRILFEVVDNRLLWLTVDVRAEEIGLIQIGQPIRFKPDGSTRELTGPLAWMSTQADVKSRTVKVRAELANPDGSLRANTFGTGRIILREEAEVVSIPNTAIQSDGCCQIVFVRDTNFLKDGTPKLFHIRKVRIGARDGVKSEIIAGVMPGELIVTNGSGLLLTELLRGSLGEGCACHSKK